MRSVRILFAAALLAAGLAAPAAAFETRDEAVAAFGALGDAARVPADWSGDAQQCAVGEESFASKQATLDAVNILRRFAGLEPVAFTPEDDAQALAAAVMIQAGLEQGRTLGERPGEGWPCYTQEGAERSLFFSSPTGGAAAIGYVEDRGTVELGNRRWLLDPRARSFGTGSTGTVNALYLGATAAPGTPVPELVAWPPGGHVPWDLVFDRWSVAIDGRVTGAAAIAVTEGGVQREVADARVLAPGYGTGTVIAWRVPALTRDVARDLTVTIAGLTVDGRERTFSYTVRAFPTATHAPAPAPTPVPIAAPAPGATPVPTTTSSPAGSKSLARAKLRRRHIARRGKRLVVRMGIARAANGDRVEVVLRARKRTRRYRATVRRGRVRVRIKLPPAFRRPSLRVTVRFGGNDRLAPASQTIRFPRQRVTFAGARGE